MKDYLTDSSTKTKNICMSESNKVLQEEQNSSNEAQLSYHNIQT